MYQAPRLERFGTFRELTQQWWKNKAAQGKNIIGDDLIPGIGLDCDGSAPPGDPRGCIRS